MKVVFLSLALVLGAVLAEPPAYRQNRYFVARQESAAPYQSRGWRPDGPAFNLPQRQQQAPDAGYGAPAQPPQNQYGPPPPQQSPQNQYGPPENQYGAPARQQQQPPLNQYGPPENQYGAPARQQQQQQQQPQSQYRTPSRQQQQQQQQPRQQYGPPQSPQGQYGPPIQGGQYPESSAPFPSSTEYPVTDYPEQQQPTTVSEFGESEAESSTPSSNSEFEEDQQDIDQPQQEQQRSQKQEQGQYYVALPDGRLQRVQYVSRQDLEAMKYFAKIKAENVEPLRGPIYAYAPLQELEVGPGQLQVAVGAPAPAPSTLTVTSSERRPEKLRQPKVDVRPLAQVQYQHDNVGAVAAAAPVVSVNAPSAVVPLSSSYTTFTANYAQQLPATVPVEDRLILAYP